MKTLVFLLVTLLFFAGDSTAQDQDYKKVEFYSGFSTGLSDGDALNGFNVSGVYNFSRYFGLKGDASAAFDTKRVTTFAASVNGTPYTADHKVKRSIFNALGGVQVKDNSNSGRVKPFAHALLGAGYERYNVSNFQCSPTPNCTGAFDATFTRTGFAAGVGGGLDVRISNRIQIRAIQLDYNPVKQSYGPTDQNARIGAGIVF